MPRKGSKKGRDTLDRFWSKVDKTDSCWLWKAALSSTGYGVFRVSDPDRLLYAHRFSYQLAKGDIPSGFCLDHLCRVPRCVNPEHLEAVTPQVNTSRGLSKKREKCIRGHDFSGNNVYYRPDNGARQCLLCKPLQFKDWYDRNRRAK